MIPWWCIIPAVFTGVIIGILIIALCSANQYILGQTGRWVAWAGSGSQTTPTGT